MARKPVGPRRVKTWTIHRPGDPDLRDPTVSDTYQGFIEAWLRARGARRQPSRRQFALTVPDPVDPSQGWHHGSLKWHLSPGGRRSADFLVRAEFVISCFALSDAEKGLLSALARRDSLPESERSHAHEQVAVARERLATTYAREEHFTEILGKWSRSILLELTACEGFRLDAEWLAQRVGPSMSVAEVQAALEEMKRLGLLVESDGEFVRSPDLHQLNGMLADALEEDPGLREVAYDAMRRAYVPMLETVRRLPNEMSGHHRVLGAILVPGRLEAFEEMETRVLSVLRDAGLWAEVQVAESPADMVYQLAVVAMPVATTREEVPEWFQKFYAEDRPSGTPADAGADPPEDTP